ncbi:hypothetical protein CXF37_01550 [Corynebacterium bovis]|nr:hypothetical protein CXF36_02805 [Corynebacterium bovis]RRO84923.1 hypothetical protein CXF37_01550 [Corynebacterium bovis]
MIGTAECGRGRRRANVVDIPHLRCFIAAYDELSFTRAAASLYVSTSALSQRIKALERHLDRVLFDRSTHVIRPTTEARRLYPEALQIVQSFDRLPEVVRDPGTGTRVRIAVPDVVGRGTRERLDRLTAGPDPRVAVEFIQMASLEMEGALLERSVDLALGRVPAVNPGVVEEWCTEEVLVIIADAEALPGDGPVSLADLEGFTLVGGPKHWRLWRDTDYRRLRRAGITLDTGLPQLDVGGMMIHLRHHRPFSVVPEDSDIVCAVDRDVFVVRPFPGVTGEMRVLRRREDDWVRPVARALGAP